MSLSTGARRSTWSTHVASYLPRCATCHVFHLGEWEQNIQRKLEVAEGVYRVVSDQAEGYRMEVLEVIVIVLIVVEIVLALFHH